jgi:hypothetical protein
MVKNTEVEIIDITGSIVIPVAQKEELDYTIKCPECGEESLIINGRCATCFSCGYSLCSI